jgi:hypothetical protein
VRGWLRGKRRVCRMRALGLFGRPSAAKQEKMRGEETRGDGIGMGGVCAPSFRALVGRLAGSLHLRTLRPSLQARRCICSCDLDACLPCCCLLLPTFNLCCAVVFTQDLLLHRRTPCISLRYADPIPLAIALALEAPPAASVSHRLYRALIPSASVGRLSHQPPATARRLPLYSRASLNLVAAVSTSSLPAAVRPFDPKTSPARCTASLCRSQPIVPPLLPCSPPNALADPI